MLGKSTLLSRASSLQRALGPDETPRNRTCSATEKCRTGNQRGARGPPHSHGPTPGGQRTLERTVPGLHWAFFLAFFLLYLSFLISSGTKPISNPLFTPHHGKGAVRPLNSQQARSQLLTLLVAEFVGKHNLPDGTADDTRAKSVS